VFRTSVETALDGAKPRHQRSLEPLASSDDNDDDLDDDDDDDDDLVIVSVIKPEQ
jgi:hypothetical protein